MRADSSSAVRWAYKLGKPFVLVRKKGKLPYRTVAEDYALEYGTATIEVHADACRPGDRVVIVDDLIATGARFSRRRSSSAHCEAKWRE